MSFRSVVINLARDYMVGHPGADNAGPNTAIHGAAKRAIRGDMNDVDQPMAPVRCLKYRN